MGFEVADLCRAATGCYGQLPHDAVVNTESEDKEEHKYARHACGWQRARRFKVDAALGFHHRSTCSAWGYSAISLLARLEDLEVGHRHGRRIRYMCCSRVP